MPRQEGFKHTPEAIANMKAACNTPESKERRRLSHLKKPLSEEHKAAIKAGLNKPETRALRSEIASRHTHTEETKQHLKEVMHSPDVNAKISEGVKRKFEDPEFKERHRQACIDVNSTDEYRSKMSEVIQRVQATDEWKLHHSQAMSIAGATISKGKKGKKPNLSSEQREAIGIKFQETINQYWAGLSYEERLERTQKARDNSRGKSTSKLELRVQAQLDALGIKYEPQCKIGWYRVDFYIPSANLILEAYGCYWHKCSKCGYNDPELTAKEARRIAYLEAKGYTVIVFWEHEIKEWVEGQPIF